MTKGVTNIDLALVVISLVTLLVVTQNVANSRIYKIIQSRIQTQDKIAKDIIQLFNSNFSNSL